MHTFASAPAGEWEVASRAFRHDWLVTSSGSGDGGSLSLNVSLALRPDLGLDATLALGLKLSAGVSGSNHAPQEGTQAH